MRRYNQAMVTAKQAYRALQAHGSVRPQTESDWTGTIALPNAISKFYREVGPDNIVIEGYGNPFHIPSLAGLWNYQTGYRWDGKTGELSPDWSAEWIAVSDVTDAVLIFSANRENILFSMHGW